MKSRLTHAFILLVLSSTLQGCYNAAISGAEAAYNHHNIKKSLDDQYITYQAYFKLHDDHHRFDDANIAIDTFNREVLITGQIPSKQEHQEIDRLVKSIPDVLKVYNLAEVTHPSSPLTRISDTWITTKIKSRLIGSSEIDPSQIKVITENGNVYLMGTVMADQADIAVDIARTTDGVQNVIKVFKYLRISKA